MKLLRGDGPLIKVGHRGAPLLAAENTLASLEAARAYGVDAIELDVVAAVLRGHRVTERTVVSSFHRPSLRALAAHAPDVRIGFTYPKDRYGVSRRRAFRPAIRLGTVALRRAVAARVPTMLAGAGAEALMLHHAGCGRLGLDGRRCARGRAPRRIRSRRRHHK